MLTRLLALLAVLLLAPASAAHANARALSLESASLGFFTANRDFLKEIPGLTHCCIKEKSTWQAESSNRRGEYLRARYMDPTQGRFLGMDPWGGNSFDPPSLHKYVSNQSDPINRIDLDGRESLISIGTAINIIGVGSVVIHAGFKIAEGDYAGAVTDVVRDAVFWALGAGVGKAIAPLSRQVMGLFSRVFVVPLELGLARSGAALTRNMEAIMAKVGMTKPAGWQAHHIVGEAYAEGRAAMDILRRFRIDVNSPHNGVFLPGCGASGSMSLAGLAVHCGKHVQDYERYVLRQLMGETTEQGIINALARIRSELTHGDLFLNARGNL